MNKKSILLDKLGISSFKEFVNQKKAVYISPKDISLEIIENIIFKEETSEMILGNENYKPFYKEYFNSK